MDLKDAVIWSAEAYSLAELKHSRFEYPLLVKADCGLYRSLEDETMSVDQLMLLHKWEESERVLAKNKEGLHITIPIDHKHKFEVYQTNRIPSKVGLFSLQNAVRCFKQPVLARFDPHKTAEFYICDKLYSSREFGLFELTAVHYLNYVKASAIDDEGKINKEYVSIIPMHLTMEFFVGKGMKDFTKDHYLEMLKHMSLSTERLVNEATHIYTLSGIMEFEDVMDKDYVDIPGYPTWGRNNKGKTLKLPLPQVPTDPPRFTNRTVCIVKPKFKLDLPWETAKMKQTLPTTNQPYPHPHSDSNPGTSSSGYETMRCPNNINKERQSYLLPSSPAYQNLPDVTHESESENAIPIGKSDQSQAEYYNDHMQVIKAPGQGKLTKDGDYYNTAQTLENSPYLDPPLSNLPNVLKESKYDNVVLNRRGGQSQTEYYNDPTRVTPRLQSKQANDGDYYNTAQTPPNTQFEDHPPSDQHVAGTIASSAEAPCDYSNFWHEQQISSDSDSSGNSNDYDDTAFSMGVIPPLLPPRRSSESTLPPRKQPLQVSAPPNKCSGGFNSVHGKASQQQSTSQSECKRRSTYKTQILHSPSQIPEDISILGIMEISDCLHHLKLGRFIDQFREFKMDGELLQQFNEEELVDQFGEFGLGSVAATTVVLFAKGAMRP